MSDDGSKLAEPYHFLWIKYFTMESQVKESRLAHKTELDFCMERMKYSPVSASTARKELNNCLSKDEITHKLGALFHLHEYPILNSCLLAQMYVSMANMKIHNRKEIPPYIIRGLIAFSYILQDTIDCELQGAKYPIFQEQYWETIPYIFEYLFYLQPDQFIESIALLSPIQACFKKFKQIYTLPKDHKIYMFLRRMLEVIVPNLHSQSEQNNWYFFEYTLDIFNQWVNCNNEILHSDPIIDVASIFIKTSTSYLSKLTVMFSYKLLIFISCFISRYCSEYESPNPMDIRFCLNCLDLIPRIIEKSGMKDCNFITRSISCFLRWALQNFSLQNELTDIYPIYTMPEPLVYQTPDQYFSTHLLFTSFIIKKFKDEIATEILQHISATLEALLAVDNECLHGFENLPAYAEKSYIPAMIILLSVLLNISQSPSSNCLEVFLGNLILSDYFPHKFDVIEGDQLKFQVVILNFCLHLSTVNVSHRKVVLKLFAKSLLPPFHFSSLTFIMPTLRSLVVIDREIQFINQFLGSGLIESICPYIKNSEFTHQIDEFVAFCQLITSMNAESVFNSIVLIPILTDLLTVPKYEDILVPVFKSGFELSKTIPYSRAVPIIISSITQISAIFIGAIENEYLRHTARSIMELFTNSIETFPLSFLPSFEENSFFDLSSKYIAASTDPADFLTYNNALTTFTIKYPQYIEIINSKFTTIYSNLAKSINKTVLSEEIINSLLSLALNTKCTMDNCSNLTIQNREAIRILISVVKGSEHEESLILAIIELCKNSSSNCFECFHADVIRYTLDRCNCDKLIMHALNLYTTISSLFYSQLIMNETFRSLYQDEETRTRKHQEVLNAIISMIIEGNNSPVSSFFHLNGVTDCIIGPNLPSSALNNPWCLATTIRLDRNSTENAPLITMIDSSGSLSISFSEKSELKIAIAKNSNLKMTNCFKYNFRKQQWYYIILSYEDGNFTLYINETKIQALQFTKLNFDSSILVQMGCNDKLHLAVDIGPTYIFSTDDVNLVMKEFAKSRNSYGQLKNTIVSLHPCLAQQGKILNASPFSDQTPILIGTAVTFCTTIIDVIEMDGVFIGFLPLFQVVNREFIGDDEDMLLASLLVILRLLLVISTDIQQHFESIGGFRLLSGFLAKIKPQYFTPPVATELVEMYKNLTLDSLRKQMVEFMWLNFSLWSEKSYEFQEVFYQQCLMTAYKSDTTNSFEFDSYDFLLFQAQTPLLIQESTEEENMEIANFTNSFIDNFFKSFPTNTSLEVEQRNKLKTLQWNFFAELFKKKPATSSFLIIYMIIAFHKVQSIQLQAFTVFERFIRDRNQEILDALQILSNYDAFVPLLSSDSRDIQNHALQCIYLIAAAYRSNHGTNDPNLLNAIHKAIGNWNPDAPDQKSFIQLLLFYAQDSKDTIVSNSIPVVFPEFIIFYFYAILKMDPANISDIKKEAEKLLLNGFTCDDPIFFVYLFLFLNHCYEINESSICLISKLIGNTCNTFFKLKYMSTILVALCTYTGVNFVPVFVGTVENFAKDIMNSNPNEENLNYITRQLCSAFFFNPEFPTELSPVRNLTKEELDAILSDFSSKSDESINQDFVFQYQEAKTVKGKVQLGINVVNVASKIAADRNIEEVNLTSIFKLPIIEFYGLVLARLMFMAEDYEDLKDRVNIFIASFNSRKGISTPETLSNAISYVYVGAKYRYFPEIIEALKTAYDEPPNAYDRFEFMKDYISKQATQFLIDYKPMFYQIRTKFAEEFSTFKYTPERMKQLLNHDGFNSYINAHQKKRLLVEHHACKLVQSFVNEATSNGGPLSSGLKEVHWKFLPMVDQKGRNLFMSPNRNFDSHKQASQLRDSQPAPEQEQEEIPLKRILSENFSFTEVSRIESMTKAKYSFVATLLKTVNRFEGKVFINKNNLVFDGIIRMDIFGEPNTSGRHKYIEINFKDIEFVFNRKHMHVNNACEIFTSKNRSYFLIFATESRRAGFTASLQKCFDKSIMRKSKRLPLHKVSSSSTFSFTFFQSLRNVCGGIVQGNMSPQELIQRTHLVDEWQERMISNFTYLARLNILSGRSLNDISQYPVFPWILNCYCGPKDTDIMDPKNYRDLSVPVGAMNDERLERLMELYRDINDPLQTCLYRSHFSNPASVIGYLIREEPFSSLHIKLQGGRYDHADRLFYSIPAAWASITGQMNDFRELTPEFFCSHHFLVNENNFDLGTLMDGNRVNDVILPEWASSAWEFVQLHSRALESEFVSQHLNEWIDLSFGVHRKSIEHNNVFHAFTYPEIVATIEDQSMLSLARNHCANFGVCPDQLFKEQHPARKAPIPINPVQISDIVIENKIECVSHGHIMTHNAIIHVASGSVYNFSVPPVNKYVFTDILPSPGIFISVIQGTSFASVYYYDNEFNKNITLAHRGSVIQCAANVDDEFLVTGGADCTLTVFNLKNFTNYGSIPAHEFPVMSVSGSVPIGLIVSVDSGHNVFVSHLVTLKYIHAFKVECTPASEHKICLLESGLIAVSCSEPFLSSRILFYDLTGRKLGQVTETSRVVRLIEIKTNEGCFLGVTTASKHVSVIDVSTLQTVKTFNDVVVAPELVQSAGKGRRAIVCVKNPNKLHVLNF